MNAAVSNWVGTRPGIGIDEPRALHRPSRLTKACSLACWLAANETLTPSRGIEMGMIARKA